MTCKNCAHHGQGKFCSNCGQAYRAERIRLPVLMHEAIHAVTHVEKGFLLNLKELAISPGTMQRRYLSGIRKQYQKPIPFFAVCGSICALALFLIYNSAETTVDQKFYQGYYVIVQASLLPCYALVTWLLFRSSKLYYAEILLLIFYMVGFISLLVIPVNLLHFILPNGPVTIAELLVFAVYTLRTYLRFFEKGQVWVTVFKSLTSLFLNFVLFQLAANFVIGHVMH